MRSVPVVLAAALVLVGTADAQCSSRDFTAVHSACCPPGAPCASGFPATCHGRCSSTFLDFDSRCQVTLNCVWIHHLRRALVSAWTGARPSSAASHILRLKTPPTTRRPSSPAVLCRPSSAGRTLRFSCNSRISPRYAVAIWLAAAPVRSAVRTPCACRASTAGPAVSAPRALKGTFG